MGVTVQNDNTAQVVAAIKAGIRGALDQSGQLVENAAARQCPVDTGRLRNSLKHQLEGDAVCQIGSDVEYGIYVECGTSRMRARAFLRPALEHNEGQIRRIFQDALGG